MLISTMSDRSVEWLVGKFIFCAVLTNFSIFATGYNLDARNAKIFGDPIPNYRNSRGSYFGFSTALYKGLSDDFAGASILVGAPRANVSYIPSVLEPGTVYKCQINGNCTEWILDPTTNGYISRNVNINQIKDNAWIGATIGVENKDKPKIMVCAPRWKNNIVTNNMPNWFMNGICYWSSTRNADPFERPADNRLIPLLGIPLQIASGSLRFYNYGMGQTGFSMHIPANSNDSDFMLGNPGVYNWRGVPSFFSLFSDRNPHQIIPQIGQESLINSGDYFGYSVSSGAYFMKGETWYASGAPRGANMRGRVLIFRFSAYADRRLLVSKVLDGEQHGEYFGASLSSCDINNDGKSEIIVGAPQWSKEMEEGRVYVYIVKNNGEFEPQYLEGQVMGARFGSTVTCLGDLDHDGYEDIAIGAPYENDHGAIYIYNGNSNGLSLPYSQRIGGESISSGIRGFGASISPPRDIDGNAYADIAVGAYKSGHVVLLRSQPAVVISVSISHENLRELQSNSTFFIAKVCSHYDGFQAPEKIDVMRILKVDPMHGRAFFGNEKNVNGTYSLPDTLQRRKRACDQLRINLVDGIENIIDPIEIGISLELTNSSTASSSPREQPDRNSMGNNFCAHCPVINKFLSKVEDSLSMSFAVDCGPDNICSSILDLSITSDLESGNRYTLGSKPTMKLMVGIANRGEAAYKTQAHIYVPSPISLGSLPRECMENPRLDGILEITCEFGNPLRDRMTSVLELDMSNIPSNSKEVKISTNVTTQSDNLNSEQSSRIFDISFDVDADMAIAGKSQDVIHSYFNKEGDEKLDVIKFQHIYEVQKFGQSPIDESSLNVLLPMYWNDQGYKTQIIEISQTFGLMEGKQFFCTDSSNSTSDPDSLAIDSLVQQDVARIEQVRNSSDRNRTTERFSFEETPSSNLPPDSRTIYLNCTNPAVTCAQISCKLGTFASSLTVAKLVINLELQLKNFQRETMEIKDIVYFVSNGSVSMKQPEGTTQSMGNKPDSVLVSTTFVGAPVVAGIAIWIVVLSILLGILLLILLTLGLVRLGFFRRKKQQDLQALKAECDRTHGFVLETSSSREALDQD